MNDQNNESTFDKTVRLTWGVRKILVFIVILIAAIVMTTLWLTGVSSLQAQVDTIKIDTTQTKRDTLKIHLVLNEIKNAIGQQTLTNKYLKEGIEQNRDSMKITNQRFFDSMKTTNQQIFELLQHLNNKQ